MVKREDADWDKPIFLATVIICVMTVAKVVFWLDIGCLVMGTGLYLRLRRSEQAKNLLLLIIVALLILPLSYFIGYRFENVAMFNDLYKMVLSVFY